jgi:hypothetical protein
MAAGFAHREEEPVDRLFPRVRFAVDVRLEEMRDRLTPQQSGIEGAQPAGLA